MSDQSGQVHYYLITVPYSLPYMKLDIIWVGGRTSCFLMVINGRKKLMFP
nr:hypothetical protein Q903MT_gene3345 [Picea sitchensis]